MFWEIQVILYCMNMYITAKGVSAGAGFEIKGCECKLGLYQTETFQSHLWSLFTCLSTATILLSKICFCLQGQQIIYMATKTGNHENRWHDGNNARIWFMPKVSSFTWYKAFYWINTTCANRWSSWWPKSKLAMGLWYKTSSKQKQVRGKKIKSKQFILK